jgi:phospholipid transport system transporter-binding protein
MTTPPPLLALPATLTLQEARATAQQLEQAIAQHPSPVCIDASALAQFDSSALAVLLTCQRSARVAGKSCQLVQAPPKLKALASLYGVEGLLPTS